MLVGLVGIVVPILPGTLLIAGALLVWAILDATAPDGPCSRSRCCCSWRRVW